MDEREPLSTAAFKEHSVHGKGGIIISQFYINTSSLAFISN